jgi:uncharacterized delta-60 repeat protein
MRYATRAATSLSILALLAGAAHADAAAGELDRSFGSGGKTIRDLGGADFVADIATLGQRRTYALVGLEHRRDAAVGVMRLAEDGRLARSFGRNGLAIVNLAGDERPGGIAVTDRGRVVVSFTSDPSRADSAFGVARFRPSGNPDPTFDRDGVQTAGFGTGFRYAAAHDVAVSGRRIVAVGEVLDPGSGSDDFAIARFDHDGELDPGFAGDGRQTTDFNDEYDGALGVAIDAEDRVVAVGAADRFRAIDPLAIARYDADGELDASFSGDGRLVSTVAPEGVDVVLQGDAITVGGSVSGDFLAARFTDTGDPDTTFSGDGVQTVDFVDGADELAAIAASGGRLVLAGTVRTGRRGRDFGVARLHAGGALDRRFSDDGRRAVDLSRDEDNALAVAIDGTGDVVAGGWAARADADTALIRLQGRGRR